MVVVDYSHPVDFLCCSSGEHNCRHSWPEFLDSDEPVFVLAFISKSTGIYTTPLKENLAQARDFVLCLFTIQRDVCCVEKFRR